MSMIVGEFKLIPFPLPLFSDSQPVPRRSLSVIASASQPPGDVTVIGTVWMGQMKQTVPTVPDVDRIDSSAMTALAASPNDGSVTGRRNAGMDRTSSPALRRVSIGTFSTSNHPISLLSERALFTTLITGVVQTA